MISYYYLLDFKYDDGNDADFSGMAQTINKLAQIFYERYVLISIT